MNKPCTFRKRHWPNTEIIIYKVTFSSLTHKVAYPIYGDDKITRIPIYHKTLGHIHKTPKGIFDNLHRQTCVQ